MKKIVRVALTQTCNVFEEMPDSIEHLDSIKDRMSDIRDANLAHHLELIVEAKKLGAQAICLGELFAAPYFALQTLPMWKELAEDLRDGITATTMRKAAQEHQILIVAPLYELDIKTGKRFNTALIIEKDGSILGSYRKTHIPEGTNDVGSFSETYYYQASDGAMNNGAANISNNKYFPVFQSSVGKIGVAICYDRHFSGVMKTLAEQGAEIIFSPAVTFGMKSRAMWEMEFIVDAARHNVFIGGSNRVGSEAPWEQDYFGASYFSGPNGRIEPLPSHTNLVVADLDVSLLSDPDPSGWNFKRDARPDIY